MKPKEKYAKKLCRIYTVAYGGLADFWSHGLMVPFTYFKKLRWSSCSAYFEWWCCMLNIWQCVKNLQGNIGWKEEPQRTISTQKSCRMYTKHLKKIIHHDRFCISSQKTISPLSTSRVRMPDTSKSIWSSVTQHVFLKVSIWHCRIEWNWLKTMKNCFEDA
jgi:hypothetical protein